MDPIYLDNNATTPLLPAVWEAMRPFAVEAYGNPASAHRAGRRARQGLEDAPERTAAHPAAPPVPLTEASPSPGAPPGPTTPPLSGRAGTPPAHLLASPVEHPSVS